MPDLGEWLLLLLVAGVVLLAVAWPLLGPQPAAGPVPDPELDAQAVRHRVALESLRDLEADRRAGSLDPAAYAAQRTEAEERAARSLAALEAAEHDRTAPPQPAGGLRPAAWIAIVLAALLMVGFALPRPVGVGEATATNQALADALEREEARQAEIDRLLVRLGADARDTETLSALADAYLAGGSAEDRRRAAAALLVLLSVDPHDASAYRRLITAYLNAGDWTNARSATHAFADLIGEEAADIAFFRGLIALRGEGDAAAAIDQFDRFLELAPDDPRAGMIRGLRTEAAERLR